MITEPAANFEDSFDAQPEDLRIIEANERDALIISAVQVDGFWVVKSYYRDDVWMLTGGPTNRGKYKRLIDFKRVPAPYRTSVKQIMYRFLRRGRTGDARVTTQTVVEALHDLLPFLRFINKLKLKHIGAVTPLVCSTYVDSTRAEQHRIKKERLLSPSTLCARFKAVEMLYELSQFTATPIVSHPWPETSALLLAGQSRVGKHSRTPLIPDDVFAALFGEAHDLVKQGDVLLDLRAGIDSLAASSTIQNRTSLEKAKNAYLRANGWIGGLRTLKAKLLELRIACYIVVASLSGCRNHELTYINSDACYRTEDDEGESYWWMRSQSDKTGAGRTEWMVPEAAVKALAIMDRWAVPFQAAIADEIALRRSQNPKDPEIAEAQDHAKAVFLGQHHKLEGRVRTLSDANWNLQLRKFAKSRGIDWHFTTHQFRRKFANYAARSRFGDLRYLREHFKHWSQDMTNDAYALNESQEMALYAEINDELDAIKLGLAEEWLSPNEPLAGGYGNRLMDWRRRDENIVLFKNHSTMVRSVAESHAIRSNGHAWCTADDQRCVGNSLEKTRCGGCENAVIGRAHVRMYQSLYADLKDLLTCKDIGPGGHARVDRDLERCRQVLVSLGYNPEATAA